MVFYYNLFNWKHYDRPFCIFILRHTLNLFSDIERNDQIGLDTQPSCLRTLFKQRIQPASLGIIWTNLFVPARHLFSCSEIRKCRYQYRGKSRQASPRIGKLAHPFYFKAMAGINTTSAVWTSLRDGWPPANHRCAI